MEFKSPDTLIVKSKDFYICFFGRKFRLPRQFAPYAMAIEQVDGKDRINVEFKLTLPFLGEVFSFTGYFRVEFQDRF
jgi:hypothetical protein